MIDIIDSMNDNMDLQKVVYSYFIQLYPLCCVNYDDVFIMKDLNIASFKYDYSIHYSNRLILELEQKYPEEIL
jgi:hypothetical protein